MKLSKKRDGLVLFCTLLAAAISLSGQSNSRNWQMGTLVETEQTKVLDGSVHHSTTDGSAKDRGNSTDYSESHTSTTTDNYDTFQIYTIDSGAKRYVAREQLLFPWSKPAAVDVGDKIKFAVEKGKMYLVGEDQKQHKATIVKTTLKSAE